MVLSSSQLALPEEELAPDCSAPAQPGDGDPPAGLSCQGAAIVDAFGDFIKNLGALRSDLSGLIGHLGDLQDTIASRGSDASEQVSLSQLGASFEDLSTALNRFCGDDSYADEDACLSGVHVEMQSVSRMGLVLSMVSVLARSTAAEHDIGGLDDFADRVADVGTDIHASSKRVVAALGELSTCSANSRSSSEAAASSLAKTRAAIDQSLVEDARLSQEEAEQVAAVETKAQELAGNTKAAMKTFVTAMQFSDRFAQRMEHIVAIHDFADPGLMRLLEGQLLSLLDDLSAVGQDIAGAIEMIAAQAKAASGLFQEGQLTETIERLVRTRASVEAQLEGEISAVKSTLSNVRKDLDHMRDTIQGTRAECDRLVGVSGMLTRAAINSTLLDHGSPQAARPLKVLSSEVQDTAQACAAALGASQDSIARVSDVRSDSLRELLDAAETLDARAAGYASQIETGRERLGRLHTLRDAALKSGNTVGARVREVEVALERVLGIKDALRDLAADFGATPADADADPGVLDQIWAMYTMEEERDVHIRVFPSFLERRNSAEDAEEESDDIDDLLF